MTVSRLWMHKFRKPAEVLELPILPDGRDLLDAFEAHAANNRSLKRHRTETYALVTEVERVGRCIVVTFRSGRYGEDGEITHIETGTSRGEFTSEDATTVVTHGVFMVPTSGGSALAFVERSGGFGGMSTLVENFEEKLRGTYHGFTIKRESVVQTDAWLERAHLMKVTGTVRKYRTDVATEGKDDVVGTLRHVIVPPGKEKYFPRRLLDGLVKRKISRSKFLGFSETDHVDEIDITVGDGDQEKTFEIDHEKTPTLRLVLTGNGEPALPPSAILERALSEAPDIFKNYDVEWDAEGGS